MIVHRQVAGVDAGQKVLNQVKLVPQQQQSTDKIGDLSIENCGFCLQVCTKPNTHIRIQDHLKLHLYIFTWTQRCPPPPRIFKHFFKELLKNKVILIRNP